MELFILVLTFCLFGMVQMRPLEKNAGKWKGNTKNSAGNYADGVNNPKKDWAKETAAAEKSYEAGVQKAIARKAFGKGVKDSGTEKWTQGVVTKGVDRFAPGVEASGDNYARGFAPYQATLENLALPARGEKGSDANYDRVKKVGQALHNKKLSK